MKIIAHRGASFEAPENTLAAFGRALDAGADGIELDVYAIEDELIVFHDRYLERLTATPGRLCDLTLAQVRQLKIFGQQRIPTLNEALAFIAGRCLVNIELKGPVDIQRMRSCLDYAVQACQFAPEQLLVSSFNHHWLQQLKRQQPTQVIGALTTCCPLDYCVFAERLNAWSVHIDVDFVTPELVADGHQRGLQVYVFTVDEAHDIEDLYRMGVDGIFTNHPAHARNVLAGLPVDREEALLHLS
ncbi:glycerophosphodiester phosphodiesterase [Idiomarina xiamenensis]|uniref:Glycerophosphoryl diester phosphodiesterase n=1 Tax=Idiomarina xiamenensis 10-D-4 TaxID=740709 RepID=K2L3W5_9GAMM|nr:glycerophosphodiester phosphodiesterase family protein [Idiomarina xiamenensis]EKE84535.1 glycerophosphoryl diester phosphodiesterase [Idiomarina xiamenensis 10-D-4]